MKKLYFLLCIFIFYSFNAQLSQEQSEAKRMKMEVAVYSQLIMEAQQVDLKKINTIILKSINKNYLKKSNLVFYIENLNPTPSDELEAYRRTPSRMRNPYFNQVTFWNKKNISFLKKNLKKNLIPYRSDVFDYGYLSPDNLKTIRLLDDSYIKQHILEQKEGKIITYKDNTVSEENIFYFPYDSQPLLLKKNGTYTNFDVILITFTNQLEKKIVFTSYYNFNEQERFVYQYINSGWKLISE